MKHCLMLAIPGVFVPDRKRAMEICYRLFAPVQRFELG